MLIENLLTDLVAEIRRGAPDFDQWPANSKSMALSMAMRDPANSAAKFKAAVLDDESFGDLRNGYIQGERVRHVLQDHMLPTTLIHAMLEENDAARIVSEHRTFASVRTTPFLYYFALAGVTVDQPIQLTETVRVLPWSQVPASNVKNRFSSDVSSRFASLDEFIVMRSQVSCAIEMDTGGQVEIDGPLSLRQLNNHETAKFLAQQQLVGDILHCIFLIVKKPIEIIEYWEGALDPAARRLYGGALSYNNYIFDPDSLFMSEANIDKEALEHIWATHLHAAADLQSILRLSIDRLSQAQRRAMIVDRAIELGIALEMLLLHALGNGELSYRMSIRGSLLVGGTKDERIKNFELLKKVYNLRSAAVHNGRFEQKDEPTAESTVKAGVSLGITIATKLLSISKFPNWDHDYIMGGAGS